MNFDRIINGIASLRFRDAVWLFPIAYTLHVLEELPQFTNWAQRYANASFTMRDCLKQHCLVWVGWPRSWPDYCAGSRHSYRVVLAVLRFYISLPMYSSSSVSSASMNSSAFGYFAPGLAALFVISGLLFGVAFAGAGLVMCLQQPRFKKSW